MEVISSIVPSTEILFFIHTRYLMILLLIPYASSISPGDRIVYHIEGKSYVNLKVLSSATPGSSNKESYEYGKTYLDETAVYEFTEVHGDLIKYKVYLYIDVKGEPSSYIQKVRENLQKTNGKEYTWNRGLYSLKKKIPYKNSRMAII